MMRHRSRGSWLLLPFLLTGCSDLFGGSEPCTEPLPPTSVIVSDGLRPTFTWSPDCRGSRMIFRQHVATTLDFLWSVGSPSNQLESGIRYGSVPKGNNSPGAPPSLIAGQRYLVELWAEDGTPIGFPVFVISFQR